MFAIKEAEECVIDEYLCLTGGATLHPSACPKKLHNIFSNLLLKLTFNLQAGRKKEKQTMWPLFGAHVLRGTL